MNATRTFIENGYNRRRFLRNMANTVAAAGFATVAFADDGQSAGNPAGATAKTGASGSFAPLKQINTDILNIEYAEDGPADGPVVILLHGWPYDIYSYADVAPLLAAQGYRVIVPYLRGFGTTRFLSDGIFRNGQPSAVALDTIALMDALKIQKAV